MISNLASKAGPRRHKSCIYACSFVVTQPQRMTQDVSFLLAYVAQAMRTVCYPLPVSERKREDVQRRLL